MGVKIVHRLGSNWEDSGSENVRVSRSPGVLVGVIPLGALGDLVMAIARLLQWQQNNASRGFPPRERFPTTQQYHKRGLS